MKLKQNLLDYDSTPTGPQIEDYCRSAQQEYWLNMKGVREVYKNFIFDIDMRDRERSDVEEILTRMLRVKFMGKHASKPPRVIVVGPPGSGRTTQSRKLAE